MGSRVGMDDVERRQFLTLSGLELQSLCRPARSQSLYRLRYCAPSFVSETTANEIKAFCDGKVLQEISRAVADVVFPDRSNIAYKIFLSRFSN
jgi:hypothetical protein